MKKPFKYKKEILFLAFLVLAGQIIFAMMSARFTTPSYESSIYATTGVAHDNSDLHKLNEAAHYFGQTMIGWTKFPHFTSDLIKSVGLPEDATINAHIQERQNIIFTIYTSSPIEFEKVVAVKDYIQEKLNSYNSTNRTQFVLSNLDYDQAEIQKTYDFGAMVALIISLLAGLSALFVKKELFRK